MTQGLVLQLTVGGAACNTNTRCSRVQAFWASLPFSVDSPIEGCFSLRMPMELLDRNKYQDLLPIGQTTMNKT